MAAAAEDAKVANRDLRKFVWDKVSFWMKEPEFVCIIIMWITKLITIFALGISFTFITPYSNFFEPVTGKRNWII